MEYTKMPIDIPEQISILKNRGLVIGDATTALLHFSDISYFRLASYWKTFEIDSASHELVTGTSLHDVLSLYAFDRELRGVIFAAIPFICGDKKAPSWSTGCCSLYPIVIPALPSSSSRRRGSFHSSSPT